MQEFEVLAILRGGGEISICQKGGREKFYPVLRRGHNKHSTHTFPIL